MEELTIINKPTTRDVSSTSSTILLAAVISLAGNQSYGQAGTPSWDSQLPKLAISNVSLDCQSLQDAWKQISERFLVRSVLAVPAGEDEARPFRFSASRCTAANLFDALVRTYAGLQWTVDPGTGVVWFHPVDQPYATILNERLRVAKDQFGVPLQTGILERLAEDARLRVGVKHWGGVFRNTFDFPVDIRAGDYTVRDVLNTACAANPTKTFYVELTGRHGYVTAVNLVSDTLKAPPPGAVLWWQIHVDPNQARAPSQAAILRAMSDTRPDVRSAANAYLEAIIWQISVEDWLRATQGTQSAWLSVALLSILARTEDATVQPAVERLQAEEAELLRDAPPELALLATLELASKTGDAAAVRSIATRQLARADLDNVLSEASAMARSSSRLRAVLHETGTDWLTAVAPAFQGIDQLGYALRYSR